MILQKTCEATLKEITTMTAVPSTDISQLVREHVEHAEPDVLLELFRTLFRR